MITIEEFVLRFVRKLKEEKVVYVGDYLSEGAIGDWLARHFSLDEMEALRRFEDEHGEEAANRLVQLMFLMAGLRAPQWKSKQ